VHKHIKDNRSYSYQTLYLNKIEIMCCAVLSYHTVRYHISSSEMTDIPCMGCNCNLWSSCEHWRWKSTYDGK